MRLAVFSDSHGETGGMIRAVRRVMPDALVHLGDYFRDGAALAGQFPELPLYAVSGNCDFNSRADGPLIFLAGPVTVFAAHGHRHGVKYGVDSLLNAAHFSGASLVLFGHTHRALYETYAGLTLLNPGSAGMGERRTFAVADINDKGAITCRITDI